MSVHDDLDFLPRSGAVAGRRERHPFAVYAITKHGVEIARKLVGDLPRSHLFVPDKLRSLAPERARKLPLPFAPMLGEQFFDYDCHIFVVSVGAVVRMIAPHLKSKKVDPAVLCIDDDGQFVISVLSGHVGRGNAFAHRVAGILGAEPVITTASDVRGTLTVDILGRDLGWTLDDPDRNVTRGCAAVVNEQPVAFIQECGEPDWWPSDRRLPPGVSYFSSLEAVKPAEFDTLLIATDRLLEGQFPEHLERAVVYRPRSLVVGIGCDRGIPAAVLERGVRHLLAEAGLAIASIKAIATVDLKGDEPALLALSGQLGVPLVCFTAAELDAVGGIATPSEVVKHHVGTRGVAEPAALLAAGASELLVTKRKYTEAGVERWMTLAVARVPFAGRNFEREDSGHEQQ